MAALEVGDWGVHCCLRDHAGCWARAIWKPRGHSKPVSSHRGPCSLPFSWLARPFTQLHFASPSQVGGQAVSALEETLGICILILVKGGHSLSPSRPYLLVVASFAAPGSLLVWLSALPDGTHNTGPENPWNSGQGPWSSGLFALPFIEPSGFHSQPSCPTAPFFPPLQSEEVVQDPMWG